MTGTNEVLKQDRRGRVRVPRERREALLEEFMVSGVSAAVFAQMVGVKYPTFANWLQKRRQAKRQVAEGEQGAESGCGIRLFEAVVEDRLVRSGSSQLVIEIGGGNRVLVQSPAQLAMAAELLKMLGSRSRGC